MPYFYECPMCGGQHGFDPNESRTFSELPERYCESCGQDGCVDCVSLATGMCETCIDRDIEYDDLWRPNY